MSSGRRTMSRANAQIGGACPYCGATNYDVTLTEERNNTQDKMKCITCSRWSVRDKQRTIQYPVQDPSDKEASIAVVVNF